MKTITFTSDKTGYLLIIVLLLACAAYGVMISIHVHLLWGGLTILVSVLSAALFDRWRKLPSDSQLIIDEAGIHDLRSNAGFIPWADIKDASVKYTGKGGNSLCIFLHDPEPYHQRFSRIRRPFMKFNGYTGLADIQINLFGLKGAEPEEIRAFIRSHIAVSETA